MGTASQTRAQVPMANQLQASLPNQQQTLSHCHRLPSKKEYAVSLASAAVLQAYEEMLRASGEEPPS